MNRDTNIPLFLWLATAALAHLAWGGGAERIADYLEMRLDLERLDAQVGSYVSGTGQDFEVTLLSDTDDRVTEDDAEPEAEEESQDEAESEDQAEDTDESSTKNETVKPEDVPEPLEKKKKPEPKPEPEKKEKKPEPPKPEPAPKDKPKKADEPAPKIEIPKTQGKIAIVQPDHEEEEPNPTAKHLADKARKVDRETQARITSTDKNESNPTPGSTHVGAHKNPGNSEEHDIKQSEESPGEMDQAPTEKATTTDKKQTQQPPPAAGAGRIDGQRDAKRDDSKKAARDGASKGTETSKKASKSLAQRGQKARPGTKAVEGSPDLATSPDGVGLVPKSREARKARKGRKARRKRLPPRRRRRRLLGLGAGGRTRGGVNLNLNPQLARDSIGRGELARIRKRDGERRRSKHRGSWRAIGLEKWRPAIENYVASVRPGNQTALNAAKAPFASYLNTIHNRLHPVFADSFLGSLDRLPGKHPMNQSGLKTNLEIVVSREDGRVVRMGVTRTSGVTAFDVAALESVQRASPFGKPPKSIVSPDGNVYLHWEFHRNPYYACSTYFARPYIIKVKPKSAPPKIRPGPFKQPKERPVERKRHGKAPNKSHGDKKHARR